MAIRLSGGQNPLEGRLEICKDGAWGTVCDDYFDMDNARVACRELGYSGASTYYYGYSARSRYGLSLIHI